MKALRYLAVALVCWAADRLGVALELFDEDGAE